MIVSCMSVSRASLLLINSAVRLRVNRGRGTPTPTTTVSRQLPFIEQKQTAPPAWFLLTIDGPADTVDEPPADSLGGHHSVRPGVGAAVSRSRM